MRDGANAVMLGNSDPQSRFTWEDWFEGGDPLLAGWDDGEATGTAHLLRHGVDVGQVTQSLTPSHTARGTAWTSARP